MKVPFIDLEAQYRSIRPAIDKAWRDSFFSFRYIGGPWVEGFEERFREITGARHCVATSNGTSSLFLILKALGIKSGDEVLTPAFSWISSAETVTSCNATPVFVDVDPVTYTLDPTLIERHINSRTRAIIAVHLYGQAAHASLLRKVCRKHGLFLIEDCAQAHLTRENGRMAGTFGDAAAFSFYPTKNLGAYGDAGCVVTNSASLAGRVRRLANHGALKKDDHAIEGINSRMDVIQAAFLTAKLPYLKQWNEARQTHAALYRSLLAPLSQVVLPAERPDVIHTYHLFVIRVANRNGLKRHMEERGVETLVHYPRSLPNSPAYAHLRLDPAHYPVSNALEKEVLSLPIYPELTEKQIRYVARNIKDFYKKVK